eukprot:9372724-Alexandrium_andersonii.AAC.1
MLGRLRGELRHVGFAELLGEQQFCVEQPARTVSEQEGSQGVHGQPASPPSASSCQQAQHEDPLIEPVDH